MRAKAVKFCENPFLHAEEGCTLCYVGVLILSTLAPISKLFFFALVHCVFLWYMTGGTNSYLVVLIGMGR